MDEKKSRILNVKRFLETETDEAHPAAVTDIIAYLESAGITAGRKAVERDIELLLEDGADIVCNDGRPKEYFVGERCFELPELKLLADAVQASRFIPPKRADSLIGKLTAFTSRHQAGKLRRSLYVERQSRPAGNKAYQTVDLLHEAVSVGRKIRCKYFDWGPDKKKIYKHGRRDYYFSPYGLVWNNDRYYAAGWSDGHGKVITLRVDRIASAELTDAPAEPKPDGFDMAFYADSVIQMYDGPLRDITLVCENDMMKHIVDRFGEGVETKILGPERFAAYIRVAASPTFFAWLFTFGGGIRIDSPEDVAAAYRERARHVLGE